jgi:hypothetical protein
LKWDLFEGEVLIIYPQNFVILIIGPLSHPRDEAHGGAKLWYRIIQQSFWDKFVAKRLENKSNSHCISLEIVQ